MEDKRVFFETKTFYGAVAAAVLIVLNGIGMSLPYEELFKLVGVWTGYSIADRFRKK